MEQPLFDQPDGNAESEADARAEADVEAGRVISNEAVRRWLASLATDKPLPRPKIGD